jgi:uncharacterized membrane protein YdjX (TVP38/TMEM64 family)
MGSAIPWLMRFGPLALIAAAAAAAIAGGVLDHLTVAEISARHADLKAAVAAHPIASLAVFVGAFAVFICLSLPGLSLGAALAGLLFGVAEGALAAVVGGTLGATVVVLATRRATGEISGGWLGRMVQRVEAGLREHGLLYLLAVRLVPIGPFWLVNLAAGCVKIPLRTYVIGTALGIAPSMALYALLGQKLGRLLDRGGRADAAFFSQPDVFLPLTALFALAFVPLAIIVIRRRRAAAAR